MLPNVLLNIRGSFMRLYVYALTLAKALNLKIINDNVRRNLRIRHRVRRNRLRSCRNRIHNLRW